VLICAIPGVLIVYGSVFLCCYAGRTRNRREILRRQRRSSGWRQNAGLCAARFACRATKGWRGPHRKHMRTST